MCKYFVAVFLLCITATSYAAPAKDLWPYWQAHNNHSHNTIRHKAWTQLLKKYDHASKAGINLFAYGDVIPSDKVKLQNYINYLQSIPILQYNQKQQEAYWINLYNAQTVNIILQHYPVKSILDINISPGWFSRGPWDAKVLTVSGKKITLNDIEHRILRPIWHDPRLHYALNCASMGCPNLQRKAFTASQLNVMLNKGAKMYINSYRGVHFKNGKLVLSKIYDWYKADFGGTDKGVITHLKRYANPTLRQRLNKVDSIWDYEYNWNLNNFS